MPNIRLDIEYDGTGYCGWQAQNSAQKKSHSKVNPVTNLRGLKRAIKVCNGVKTIQETIEKILCKVLQEKITLTASGRTDSGVHALNQVANFKTNSQLPLERIQKALNSLLPQDITITAINKVPEDFHSRYCAKSKVYRYFILNSSTPCAFLNKFTWNILCKLDLKTMRQAARALEGRHDFKSFCASGSRVKDTVRTVKKLVIKESSYHLSPNTYNLTNRQLIAIDIEADGFLYNMVRNIVGTIVEIGKGRLEKSELKRILLARDRKSAGPTAPAKGLFLVQVNY